MGGGRERRRGGGLRDVGWWATAAAKAVDARYESALAVK